jgi:hypothetical protein
MSTDLDFHGNQLVHFQTIFVLGNVLGLLPFAYLFPKVPMHILVPTLDLCWGLFNLAQYRANSYAEIMAYRFMVSIFEVTLIISCGYYPFANLVTTGVVLPRRPFRARFLVQA